MLLTYGIAGWHLTQFVSQCATNAERTPYKILGIALPTTTLTLLIWLSAIGIIILLTGLLTSPLANMRTLFARWAHSELQAFVFMLMLSLAAVFLLTWLHKTLHAVVIIAATTLARLDIDRGTNLTKLQDFLILTSLALLGLGLGWVVYSLPTVLGTGSLSR
jgi:hypothetical protein